MKRTFVVGCPRSGATVVQAMLARHPAVFAPPETAFFAHLHGDLAWRWGDAHAQEQPPRWRQQLGFTRKHERQWFESFARLEAERLDAECPGAVLPDALARPSTRRRTLRRRFVLLLDALARARGREMWLEKTPDHLLYLPDIEAAVPGARFVHVVRPGAEVIASLMDVALLSGRDNAFGGGIIHWARRWHRAMQIHAAHMDHPRHYLLFLEDLIAQPQQEWRHLCGFLGLDPSLVDDDDAQAIADLQQEPWQPRAPESRIDDLCGGKMRPWLRTRLASYDALRTRWLQMRGSSKAPLVRGAGGASVVALASRGS